MNPTEESESGVYVCVCTRCDKIETRKIQSSEIWCRTEQLHKSWKLDNFLFVTFIQRIFGSNVSFSRKHSKAPPNSAVFYFANHTSPAEKPELQKLSAQSFRFSHALKHFNLSLFVRSFVISGPGFLPAKIETCHYLNTWP